MPDLSVSAIKSVFSACKSTCLSPALARYGLILIILQCKTLTGFAAENEFTFVDNEPFWYAYQRFDGYHTDFTEFEPAFLREINKQDLDRYVTGEPFNIYFSETDWAIGCRVKKKIEVSFPLEIEYYKNRKVVKTIYQGKDQDIPLFLEVASSFIKDKDYYWDGYLVLNRLIEDQPSSVHEIVIPVSKDYYHLFIRPYGIVRIVTTFLCLLLAIFLLRYSKGSVISNRILGTFMLLYVLINCNDFVWIYNMYQQYPHFYNFANSFQFLLPPLMLLYTLSVVKESFRINKAHLLHILPFLVVAFIYFFLYQIYDAESKLRLLSNGFRESPFFDWVDSAKIVQQLCYLLVSVFIVFYHPFKNKHLPFKPEKHLLTTLKYLLIGILFLTVVNLVEKEIHFQKSLHYSLKILEILVYLTMISTLIVRGLLYPEMFSNNGRNRNGQKYNKSPLTPEHKYHYLRKIKSYMEESQPYLSSFMNLTDFAKEVSIPSRYLSQVLNEEMGMSFYDFMNKYRIAKAGELLSNPDYNDNSIIDIAWECGFNSKSVFNASFKKFTGMTPTEFRIVKQPVSL